MPKKEFYKHILPHYQQPGQAYFVTWCLKESIPGKIVKKYSQKLEQLKLQIDSFNIRERKFSTSGKSSAENRIFLEKLKNEYYSLRRMYFKAFDSFLDAQKKNKSRFVEKRKP